MVPIVEGTRYQMKTSGEAERGNGSAFSWLAVRKMRDS
jgi:hypothetical protein